MQTGGGAQVGGHDAATPTPSGRGVHRSWLVALGLTITALDQITKSIVVATLPDGESRPVIDDFLRLSHFRNSGSAFGLIRGFGGLLALAALIGVISFFAVVVRRPAPVTGVAAALVAGGALGNLLDRLIRGPFGRGTVVDFVDFRFWPAFNVADSAITVGALLLVWAGLSERRTT